MNVAGAFPRSGPNLSAVSFLHDACSAPKRPTCLANLDVRCRGRGAHAEQVLGFLSVAPEVERGQRRHRRRDRLP